MTNPYIFRSTGPSLREFEELKAEVFRLTQLRQEKAKQECEPTKRRRTSTKTKTETRNRVKRKSCKFVALNIIISG